MLGQKTKMRERHPMDGALGFYHVANGLGMTLGLKASIRPGSKWWPHDSSRTSVLRNTGTMRATVVIPAYNSVRTIQRAVAAATTQSANVDVVVCDDGSSDDTAAVAENAGARVLRLPHGGQSRARNAGIEAAQSDVIVFCDSDDWLAEDAIVRMIAAFEPGVGVVAGRVEVVGEEARRVWPPDDVVGDLTVADFLRANWIGGCTAAIRRDLAREIGGFDPGLAHTMDYNLWIRAAARARVVRLREVVGYVDRSRPSFSSDRAGALRDRLVMLERLVPDVASRGDVLPALARTAEDLAKIERSLPARLRWRRQAKRWRNEVPQ